MTDPTPAQTEAETETMTEDAPASEQETGWSPNPSRRRIVVAVGAILIGVLVALFAWGLPPFAGSENGPVYRHVQLAIHRSIFDQSPNMVVHRENSISFLSNDNFFDSYRIIL